VNYVVFSLASYFVAVDAGFALSELVVDDAAGAAGAGESVLGAESAGLLSVLGFASAAGAVVSDAADFAGLAA
jgi:hypothetical protein